MHWIFQWLVRFCLDRREESESILEIENCEGDDWEKEPPGRALDDFHGCMELHSCLCALRMIQEQV